MPKLPSGQVVNWDEGEAQTLYSNIMGFATTPFDITLVFGQIGKATAEDVNALVKVKIILSPEQVANLAKLLEVAVKAYVSKNGSLRTSGALDAEAAYEEANRMSNAGE